MAKTIVPFRLGKALNYHYKILKENFTRIPYSDPAKPNKIYRRCKYTVDLAVEKHPEYPDIPTSVWTVEVQFDEDGGIRSCVKPKEKPKSLKQAIVVLIDWKVRIGWADGNFAEGCLDACKGRLGPDGWELGRCFMSLDEFTGDFDFMLEDREFVLVSLTFIPEKNGTRWDPMTLFDSGTLSDCKVVCGEQEFPVHRAILAAQSPVFGALFQTDMKGKSPGIVEINDTNPDVLEILLKYIYTRDLTKADVDLTEVWIAAEKFAMLDLMKECERLMLGSITHDNALKYLTFGAEHGLKTLKIEAAKIISQGTP